MENEIISFIKNLKGKVPEKTINNRINFFNEILKYQKIELKDIDKKQIGKINELKQDYVSTIDKNKNLSLDELIQLCIVPINYDTKTKQITIDYKKQNFDNYQIEYKENMRKLKIWLTTGIFIEKGKEVTWDKSLVYDAYIRTKDFETLRKLYKEGCEILKSENREKEIKIDYEWLN